MFMQPTLNRPFIPDIIAYTNEKLYSYHDNYIRLYYLKGIEARLKG